MTEQVTNGGFETGDFTGWSEQHDDGVTHGPVGGTGRTGSYAYRTIMSVSDTWCRFEQTIDYTDVDHLYFYLNIPTYDDGGGGTDTSLTVIIDGTEKYRKEATTAGYILVDIDTSALTGALGTTFECRCGYDPS